jgi:hypothetical protein
MARREGCQMMIDWWGVLLVIGGIAALVYVVAT